MITEEKLKIYEYYHGSLGAYERAEKRHTKILNWSEFNLIERIIQDLKLIKNGFAAGGYEQQVNERIKGNCDTEETAIHIKAIALK